jgi:ubiquitin-activating enzyme E1
VIIFSDVKGMDEISTKEFPVKVLGPCTFSIGDEYERGDVVLQVKQPKVVSFKPLPITLKEMKPVFTDFAKFMSCDVHCTGTSPSQ